jgi:selenocysteine lyase/cysteine desulfurase
LCASTPTNLFVEAARYVNFTINTTASGSSLYRQRQKSEISLRTGCFCNPGAGEVALEISRVELDVCFTQPGHEDRLTVDDFRSCIDGKSSGAVRISVGMVTNFNDIQGFLDFARGLLTESNVNLTMGT